MSETAWHVRRRIHATVLDLVSSYPAVAITGPRQSGKTTLARQVFADRPYVSLEDPDELDFATQDPRAFLENYRDGAVFDEVQRAPHLFSYLQSLLDEERRMGRFVLTGSQQFSMVESITQSLAGRVALVRLLPFSLSELRNTGREPGTLDQLLFQGLYPPIYDRELDPTRWYGNYVRTYIERDVRRLLNVRDLTQFQRFLRLCAGRTGQVLNLSALGTDAGASHHTVRSWLSVLEASFVVHQLRPHHANFNKRLTKSPKLYFYDPGLAAWLLGIQTAEDLAAHPLRGELFETWAVSELLKMRFDHALESNLSFWRARQRLEIDVLADHGVHLVPIEIKSSQTISRSFFRGLTRWRELAGDAAGRAWLLYGGESRQSRTAAEVIPWRQIDAIAPALLPERLLGDKGGARREGEG
ncbi:MAG: ATP-binding protein [Acidobacteriota bacterium]